MGEKKPGLLEVAVGSMVLLCRESDIELVKVKKSPKPTPAHHRPREKPVAKSTQRSAQKLDLHGLRVEEAIRRVEGAIDRAIMADVERMEIVHGLGTGKIRKALHKYLANLSVVASFKIDDANAGITIVYF